MDLCSQAEEIANNVAFNALLVTVTIVSKIAIVLQIWIILKITNRVLLHQNIRILFIVHQLWLILHCVARIFAHTYVFVNYRMNYVDNCEYMKLPWECFMTRTPITLTLLLSAASIPTIVIERAIATYFASKYEKFGKAIAVILIIMQLTVGISSFVYLVGDFKFDSTKVVYCSSANKKNSRKSAIVFGIYVSVEIISAISIQVLRFINEKFHRNKIHAHLSQRYQTLENINSLKTLSPMVTFHSVFMTFYLGILFVYFAFGIQFTTIQFAIYLEGLQQTPLYALLLPFVIMWAEQYVNKNVAKKREKAIHLHGQEAINHYFNIFEIPEGKNVTNQIGKANK